MAVFSDGGVSSPDIYISVSYICVIIACTVLNSLVFVHNFQKKSSVARNLYLFLSAADLLTSWVLLGASSVDFLKEKEEECRNSDEVTCNKEYFKRVVDATLGVKLYSVISYTMSLSPAHITAFLAGTRFLQIRYPLHPLQLKYVISSLLITITWQCCPPPPNAATPRDFRTPPPPVIFRGVKNGVKSEISLQLVSVTSFSYTYFITYFISYFNENVLLTMIINRLSKFRLISLVRYY